MTFFGRAALLRRPRIQGRAAALPYQEGCRQFPKLRGELMRFLDIFSGFPLRGLGSAIVPIAVGRVSRPHSFPDSFLWILL